MAAIVSFDTFKQTLDHTCRGGNDIQNWKTNLKNLTETTMRMIQSAEKTAELKSKVIASIHDVMAHATMNPKQIKDVLLSLFSGIDEFQAQLMKMKKSEEIEEEIKIKINSIFDTHSSRSSSVPSINTGRNLKIMTELATQLNESEQQENRDSITSRIAKTGGVAISVGSRNVLNAQIQLHLSSKVHEKAIENIAKLSKTVEDLSTNVNEAFDRKKLQDLMNEARSAMQDAGNIMMELTKYDDPEFVILKKQVQGIQDKLEEKKNILSSKMEAFFSSKNCETATEDLENNGDEGEKERFSTSITLYTEAGERAGSLIQVVKAIQKADEEFKSADKTNVEAAGKAIQTAQMAINHIGNSLGAFTEVAAAIPAIKKTNPFLAKLKNAQQRLTEQTKMVVENPVLKEALEKVPEVKKAFTETVVDPVNEALVKTEEKIKEIDTPTPAAEGEYTETQLKFFTIVRKTVSDQSKLEKKLLIDICNLAMKATPVLKIKEAGLLTQSDSFTIANMMVEYITLLSYIYDKLIEAGSRSKQEAQDLNNSMVADGVHELATFMADEYYPIYLGLKEEIKKLVGDEVLKEFQDKLNEIWGDEREGKKGKFQQAKEMVGSN